jgi:hypothetical protein
VTVRVGLHNGFDQDIRLDQLANEPQVVRQRVEVQL